MSRASGREPDVAPDLGDLVLALLAGTLAGLRDRLASDGFDDAAEVVAELVELTDDHLLAVGPRRDPSWGGP